MTTNMVKSVKPANALAAAVAKARAKAEANKGRMIFGFDATASRGPTWTTAQELQAAMFAGVKRLDVQLAVFRGDEQLASTWEDDPEKLRELMKAIDVVGGETQIRWLLEHVLAQHAAKTVNAFVFIGDTFEEWPKEAATLAAAKALGDLRVPGFFFLEGTGGYGGRVKGVYEQLAKLTGGAYAPFDANSATFLGDLLNAVASFASGGFAALAGKGTKAATLLLGQMKK